jgi:CubicO group peptidase (beta-lactamase class C family)
VRSRRLAWLVVAAALSPARAAAGKDPKPEAPPTALAASIDAAVSQATKGAFWGTVLVARGGAVVFAKGYGFADYEKRPNAPDSLFEIASASKQVTAAAILRLEQQKKLKTTDPIDKVLVKAPKDKHAVTIDHLLHHTSGLSPQLGVPYDWSGSLDQYVPRVLEAPLVEEPGAKFSYSNVGYALLAGIVEVVSGRSFEDYVRKELFEKAGMADTGFIRDSALVKSDRVTRRVCDDCARDWTAANWFWGWGYRGMGGVVTTALDLVKWDRALRGDKILGPAAREKLYVPAREGYACGWNVETTDRGTRVAHHSGGVRGYACDVARWIEEDALVVVLSNGKTNVVGVRQAIGNLLFAPPKIEAEIDVEGLELGDHRVLEKKEGLSWAAATEEGRLALRLRIGKHVVATVRAPAGVRAALASDLDRAIADSSYPKPDEPAAMEGGVYLGMLGDGTKFRLDDGLALRVMPRYQGMGEGGKLVEGPRAVLILEARSRGGWPMMVKMNPAAAKALAELLRKA